MRLAPLSLASGRGVGSNILPVTCHPVLESRGSTVYVLSEAMVLDAAEYARIGIITSWVAHSVDDIRVLASRCRIWSRARTDFALLVKGESDVPLNLQLVSALLHSGAYRGAETGELVGHAWAEQEQFQQETELLQSRGLLERCNGGWVLTAKGADW